MANEKKMDQVLLGLLSHESMSGYAMKKKIDTWLTYFWSGSYGSIYPTLGQLAEKGLVTKEAAKDSGREKNIYTITEAGRQHLKNWLEVPEAKDELRYETLLKLFFANEGGLTTAISHIDAFEKKVKQNLAMLEIAYHNLQHVQDDPTHRYYLLTVMFGLKSYQSSLQWCEEAKKLLEEGNDR